MRRQLIVMVVAVTAMVLLAFLVPLSYLVLRTTEDRAVRGAVVELETLRILVGVSSPDDLAVTVDGLNSRLERRTAVFFADGTAVGEPASPSAAVQLARQRGEALDIETAESVELVVPVDLPTERRVIRVLITDAQLREGVLRSWLVLGALGIGLLALAVAVADRLARQFVRPTVELSMAAGRLEAGDLTARVDPAGPPETREVAHALNRLAERITELFTRERETVADLSHRLRTPAAALRLDAEALHDPEERARLSDDVDALERMVDDVIHEARRPVREGGGGGCDVVAVVAERTAFWAVLAEDQNRRMDVRLPPGPARTTASDQDLVAAVDVLLGNVFSHTGEGVGFRVEVQDGAAA